MLFSWFKRRRRRRIIAQPFPDDWEAVLHANFPRIEHLSPSARTKLRDDMQVFVAEKNWEGVFGLELTDEIRVTVAAQACYLILGRDVSSYDNVLSILVYPDAYSAPQQFTISNGFVIEGRSQRLGEAWHRGPVVLSWPDVLNGGREPASGRNLVFHEFAHQLDMLSGRQVNGTPRLESTELSERWKDVVSREYQQLRMDCRYHRPRLLDCYGTTNPGEFFAVATELFFQQPVRMRRRHPELFQLFSDYYRHDPAERIVSGGSGSVPDLLAAQSG